jgi:hypothetical protein
MTSAVAADVLRDQAEMETGRSNYDNTNQRIAELIWPNAAMFNAQSTPGERRDKYQFDSTASLALPKFASATESILIPRTQQYQTLVPQDESLRKDRSVMAYCEEVTKAIFRARYAPGAGFTHATGEALQSHGAFGAGCIYTDELVGRDLFYRNIFVGDIWIREDHAGRIDGIHRRLKLTARQIAQKFREESIPENVRKEMKTQPSREYEFIHCVKERPDYDPGRQDFRGMPFVSYYVMKGPDHLVEEGGYRTMPYSYSRFRTAPGEMYGRGPADSVLNVLNLINEQQKTLLRSGQRAVDPPIMLVDDDGLEAFNLKSGALNRGFIGPNGEPLAVPFNSGANMPIGLEMVQDSREVINDAFFVNLFRVLVDAPSITATEALLRAQEKGELLGPAIGRLQQEMLDSITVRELDILSRVPGFFPEMPEQLEEAGGFLAIKYDSPVNKMQRAGDGVAIQRFLETMTPLEQIEPGTIKKIASVERMGRKLAESQGVPESVLLDEDEQVAHAEAEAEAQQAQMLMQAAPIAGKTAVDMAKAQAMANAQPSAAGFL